jgi:putative transposase
MAPISDKLLDELLRDYDKPEDLLGKEGIIAQLKKRLIERAMEAEMDEHLGYKKHEIKGRGSGNSRNGHASKQVITDDSRIDIAVPRDLKSDFEPQIIPKDKRRFDGFDDKVIAMYARGMSTRDIQGALEEMYGVDVAPSLISTVTASIIDDFHAWQSRPLDQVYPMGFFDCLAVKCRSERKIRNKSVYLALGVNMEGKKELLGLWVANTEGAKFWLGAITELKNRGVQDMFIASIDGLKGFPEAIETVYPQTEIQLCIVHMVRNSCKYVSWKDRKELCADLKEIYSASTIEQAEMALKDFAAKWDAKHPSVSQLWQRNWERIIPFINYPDYIRKAIYTTNAIESVNRSLKKILKTKGAFPSDDSIFKLLYLALDKISKKWTMPIRNWKMALGQLAIRFEDRFPMD